MRTGIDRECLWYVIILPHAYRKLRLSKRADFSSLLDGFVKSISDVLYGVHLHNEIEENNLNYNERRLLTY